MTPDLPPPELPRFAKEPSAMGTGRPLSVSLAVCLAWAVVAIGLLSYAYYFLRYPLLRSQPMTQEQIWWNIYGWVMWFALLLAGIGVWLRSGLTSWALSLTLGVDVALHAWGVASTIVFFTRYPDGLSDRAYLIQFAIFSLVPLALKTAAMVLMVVPPSRSWFNRSAR